MFLHGKFDSSFLAQRYVMRKFSEKYTPDAEERQKYLSCGMFRYNIKTKQLMSDKAPSPLTEYDLSHHDFNGAGNCRAVVFNTDFDTDANYYVFTLYVDKKTGTLVTYDQYHHM